MAKKTKQEVNGNVIEPIVDYNNTALALIKDEINNDWVVVQIPFNLTEAKTQPPQIIERERNFGLAKERFIILMSRTYL